MARGKQSVEYRCELGHLLEADAVTHVRVKDVWAHATPTAEVKERDWQLAERQLGVELPRPVARPGRTRPRRRRR